ncbi:Chromo domain protein [Ophiocordyceps camponoti-floridani]|uniref:Chromo domain protein n=1 Tax=Ophiocordyceps camponoti-floridani TaxID=2030778 RepID=A0A8H4QAL6_9HYPO|nr:Chromo domain protein [Ophiocordyceps camponoti-floridani]
MDEEFSSFSRFVNHRWAGTSMEIQVQWKDGDVTWEPEANLHADALETLLEYWAGRGGRPSNPLAPDMYDIFAIRKHSRDRRRLMVEWVGYDPKEASWIRRAVVEDTAPQLVEEYWKRVSVCLKGE